MTKRAAAALACLMVGLTAVSAAEPIAGKRWAVVIGVKEYNDGLFRRLEYSTNDARLVYRLLTTRCQFAAEQTALMIDEAAEPRMLPFQRQIVAEVTRVAGLAQQGDTVLVFFSGHGVPDGAGGVVMASRDCDKKRPAQTGIPVAWLREVLEKSPARQVTAHPGLLPRQHGAAEGETETTKLAPVLRAGPGVGDHGQLRPGRAVAREWPRRPAGALHAFPPAAGSKGPPTWTTTGIVDVEEL